MFFLPDDGVYDNSLNPLRELSNLLDTPDTDLLMDQPLTNKIRGWVAAAAVIIPVAIQIITLFNKSPLFKQFFGG